VITLEIGSRDLAAIIARDAVEIEAA